MNDILFQIGINENDLQKLPNLDSLLSDNFELIDLCGTTCTTSCGETCDESCGYTCDNSCGYTSSGS